MKYNFDEIIERKNTDSLKYDFAIQRKKPEGILPLWVADMDFQTPPCVIEALADKCRHGIFGYSDTREDYDEVLKRWFLHNFNWMINPKWLIKTPGVVYAICAAIRALTKKDDAVLVQQPCYYPFSESVLSNKRSLIVNELLYENGKYSIDFEDFEQKIIKNHVKLFILCNPQNPTGRVWTKEELLRIGDICLKYHVIVILDEIHADFIYSGYRHHVFASLKPEFNDITITCTAPSKTFNLAALQISNIFISNAKIRYNIQEEITKSGYSQPNVMGICACKAAYEGGYDWLVSLRAYIERNLKYLRNYLAESLPQIKLVEPEGTYLVWLDCKELGMNDKELGDFIIHKAGLWLDEGTMFGRGGEGFLRINIACPISVLEKALIQLEEAIKNNKL